MKALTSSALSRPRMEQREDDAEYPWAELGMSDASESKNGDTVTEGRLG
jgi:hypothetical protein